MLLFVTLHKDTNTGVKEQKGTEGGGGDRDTHALSACRHLPVSIPTCTAWNSPESHMRWDGALLFVPPVPFSCHRKPPF